MNERLKELLEQATEVHDYWHTGKSQSVVDYKMFAELIVRECIDTVSDCSIEYCTRPQIVSEIKEHFGVE